MRRLAPIGREQLRRALRDQRFEGRCLARGPQLDEAIEGAQRAGEIHETTLPRKDARGRAPLRPVFVAEAPSPTAPAVVELDGPALKRWLRRADMTQGELARHVGLTTDVAVSRWTRRGVPPGQRAEALRALRKAAADRLGERRRAAGLYQEHLGSLVGVRQSVISAWERNELAPSEEQWVCLEEALERALSRPRESELIAEEIDQGLERAWRIGRVSQRTIAARAGINPAVLSLARHGRKRIARHHWAAFRAEVKAACRERPRDRVRDEALPAVPEAVTSQPGILTGQLVADRPDGIGEPLMRQAVALALAERRIHRAPQTVEHPSGRRREYLALRPGPPRGPLRRRDRAAELVTEAVAQVSVQPGCTRAELGKRLGCDVKLTRRAVTRALADDQIHERTATGPDASGRRRPRRELWPGKGPAHQPTSRRMPASTFRRELDRRAASSAQLAATLDAAPATVAAWRYTGVPAGWVPGVRGWLAEKPVLSAGERDRAGRDAIVRLVSAEPGLTRRQLSSRLAMTHRRRLGRLLAQALDAHEVYLRPRRGTPSGLGLYPGPTPPRWQPGACVTGQDLLDLRTGKRWNQRQLADRLGTGAPQVCAWEKQPQTAIPMGWWARARQLEREPAATAPAPDPPLGWPLMKIRIDRDWEREDLATTSASVTARWPDGSTRMPRARPGPTWPSGSGSGARARPPVPGRPDRKRGAGSATTARRGTSAGTRSPRWPA